MNEEAIFDKLIAAKLVGLPVPDMSEETWQQVQQHLYPPLPDEYSKTSNNHGNTPWIVTGLAILLLTFFYIFFIKGKMKHKNKETEPVKIISPANQAGPGEPDSLHIISFPQKKINPVTVPGIKTNSFPADSSNDQSILLLPLKPVDTTNGKLIDDSNSIPAKSLPLDSSKRKSIGVKGINDSDYHIIIKKDSTQQ